MEAEVDPQKLQVLLDILTDSGVAEFKCAEFQVSFFGQEEDDTPVADNLIGFSANSDSDDDYDDYVEDKRKDDGPQGMLHRLFRRELPTLNVVPPKTDADEG